LAARFDVVLIRSSDSGMGGELVKRILGLSGDRIEIVPGSDVVTSGKGTVGERTVGERTADAVRGVVVGRPWPPSPLPALGFHLQPVG
jgi:hypothetical protein